MAGGGGNEPNLTPLIDLFSVLIVFLLMTASWLQLESVQVQVDQKPGTSASENIPPPSQEEEKEKKVKLGLKLFNDRVVASEDNKESTYPVTKKSSENRELGDKLRDWQARFPAKNSIVITSDSSASYGQLIRLYDFVVGTGWTNIGISPY